ncbi:serine protease [Paenibacillus sp. FSL K6-1318]|uniref:S1 family peptidase n=1 Tax=Paenibacillus sp. FSL K6-1318 TaxID=2975291 RepID=UPI0030EE17E4
MDDQELIKVLESVHKEGLNSETVTQIKSFLKERLRQVDESNEEYSDLIATAFQTLLKAYICPIVIIYEDKDRRKIENASGVLMDINESLFLVTNKHVTDFYFNNENCIFKVGDLQIDLATLLIDVNETLDLATISLSHDDLKSINVSCYKEPYRPQSGPLSNFSELVGEVVTVVGYPGVLRHDNMQESVLGFGAYSGPVSDVSEISITIPIDMDQVVKLFGEDDPELLRIRLGGFSGGGVFILKSDGEFHLVGIIKEDLGSFLYGLKATPSNMICKNGMIVTQYDLYNGR